MIRIVVSSEIANHIRGANEQVELVDEQGKLVGVVRRPPTTAEIEFARTRLGSKGPKLTIDQLIARVETL